MSDLSETFLEDVRRQVSNGPKCAVRLVLENVKNVSEDLHDQVVKALSDTSSYQSAAISRELKRRGFVVNDHSISRHRRKMCACERAHG